MFASYSQKVLIVHFTNSGFKKIRKFFFWVWKVLNEMDFTINGFSQKMYVMAVIKLKMKLNFSVLVISLPVWRQRKLQNR